MTSMHVMAKKTAFDRIQLDLTKALNGRGLIFTPFHAVDPEKFAVFAAADDYAWTGGVPSEPAKLAEQFVQINEHVRARGTQFDFLLQREPGGPYIGYANVMLHPHNRTAKFGYYIQPSQRNQGLATEVASIIKDQMAIVAPRIGLNELVANVREDNLPSRRVLEKAGLENRGIAPSQFRREGTYLDFATRLAFNKKQTQSR